MSFRFENTEFEQDRKHTELEFPSREFDIDSPETREELDTISWFFTHKRALASALLISNFQLATFEIKNQFGSLLDSSGEGDPIRRSQLENDCIINAQVFQEGTRDGIFRREKGITTYFADQRHFNIPVYSLASDHVFKSAIIAAFLLCKYDQVMDFPEMTDPNLDSLFTTQIIFLSNLDPDEPRDVSVLQDAYQSDKRRAINRTTFADLAATLYKAGFVERIGETILISRDVFQKSKDRTVFRGYIDSLMLSTDHLHMSYEDLRAKLIEMYEQDPHTTAEREVISQNVSKYLGRLVREERIQVNQVRQKYGEKDYGHFGVPYSYVITPEGQLFLDLVRSLVEGPQSILGRGEDFHIFANGRLKEFWELSNHHQIILIHMIRKIFE